MCESISIEIESGQIKFKFILILEEAETLNEIKFC